MRKLLTSCVFCRALVGVLKGPEPIVVVCVVHILLLSYSFQAKLTYEDWHEN